MATFRVQLIVGGMAATGWSEMYYCEASGLAQAVDSVEDLVQERTNCFATGTTNTPRVVWYRVTDALDPRVSVFKAPNKFYSPADNLGPTDMPWTGVLCRLKTALGTRRMFCLRGVPDTDTLQPWTSPPGGKTGVAVEVFLGRLVQSEWRMQVVNPAIGVLVDITGVNLNAAGQVVIQRVGHGLATGDVVSWFRVKASPGCLQGRSKIVRLTADTFLVPGTNFGSFGFTSGQYRKISYIYSALNSAVMVRKASRQTGRPFALLVGRRRRCRR